MISTEDKQRIEDAGAAYCWSQDSYMGYVNGATAEHERMAELLKEEKNKAIDPEIIEALLACETTLKAFLPDAFATISIVEQAIKKAKGKSQ